MSLGRSAPLRLQRAGVFGCMRDWMRERKNERNEMQICTLDFSRLLNFRMSLYSCWLPHIEYLREEEGQRDECVVQYFDRFTLRCSWPKIRSLMTSSAIFGNNIEKSGSHPFVKRIVWAMEEKKKCELYENIEKHKSTPPCSMTSWTDYTKINRLSGSAVCRTVRCKCLTMPWQHERIWLCSLTI